MVYAQHAKESSKYEQAALNEKMLEYKRQVDQENRQYLNGSRGSSNRDSIQPFARSSHKEIKEVMQSAAEGKVFSMIFWSLCLYFSCFCFPLFFGMSFYN